MTPEMKMIKARANLVMGQPFFGSLALRLKIKENPNIETGRCDGQTIEYNPKFIEGLQLSKVQGFIAHETMHPALLHHTRRGSRDVKKWNIACDYAVNDILTKAGFDLPSGAYAGNPAYKDMPAEQIYTLIPDNPKDNNNNNSNGNGNGNGNGNDNDPGGDGGVADSPSSQNGGGSESQERHEEAEWKVALAQATHVAKQSGTLPAGMERLVEELMKPTLPWRSILHRFMTERKDDDFSWSRGNRRFLAQGLYLPSRKSDSAMGEMVVAIDTSGSIDEEMLNAFGSEISGIVKEVRPTKTIVIYCDSDIAHVDEFMPEDELVFKAHGGGGTDFRPPFEWLKDRQIEPRAFVYLTDGYGPFPEEEARFPTMWAINNHEVEPPWGEHLIVEV